MIVGRAMSAAKRTGAAVFWRFFGARSERQLWGMMVPRERPRVKVGVMIIARANRTGAVTWN